MQSPSEAELILVIPAFNESKRLDTASFEAFLQGSDSVSLLFVDDGSTDGTRAILETMRAEHPGRIELIGLDRNVGKAEAVRLGLVAALVSNASVVGYWDADLSTPLSASIQMRDLMEGDPTLDIVMGARVRLLGRVIERQAARHYLGRVFATLASMALGLGVYDTQCGAKLLRAESVARSCFDDPFRSRWAFDVEWLGRYVVAARSAGLDPADRIHELPLGEWTHTAGSKVGLLDGFRAFADVVGVGLRLRRGRRR